MKKTLSVLVAVLIAASFAFAEEDVVESAEIVESAAESESLAEEESVLVPENTFKVSTLVTAGVTYPYSKMMFFKDLPQAGAIPNPVKLVGGDIRFATIFGKRFGVSGGVQLSGTNMDLFRVSKKYSTDCGAVAVSAQLGFATRACDTRIFQFIFTPGVSVSGWIPKASSPSVPWLIGFDMDMAFCFKLGTNMNVTIGKMVTYYPFCTDPSVKPEGMISMEHPRVAVGIYL